MARSRLNLPELAGALALMSFGLFAVWKGFDYPIGTPRRLGAGALPVGLGIALVGFGIVLALQSSSFERIGRTISLRVLGTVVTALMIWALVVPLVGFVAGTILLVMVSSLADGRFRPVSTAVLALALAVAGLVIFVYGLRIPLPLGPL